MPNDDVPLGEAGRDHYARQFGSRIQKIRQYGAPPPSPAGNTGCGRVGIGAGVGVIFLIIRLAIGIGGSSRTSNYNNYTPSYTPPPQVNWPPPGGGLDQDRPLVIPNDKGQPLVIPKDKHGEAFRRLIGEKDEGDPPLPPAPNKD